MATAARATLHPGRPAEAVNPKRLARAANVVQLAAHCEAKRARPTSERVRSTARRFGLEADCSTVTACDVEHLARVLARPTSHRLLEVRRALPWLESDLSRPWCVLPPALGRPPRALRRASVPNQPSCA